MTRTTWRRARAVDCCARLAEGERYAICLRSLGRASFPQRVRFSARRAKPAECFGATGLSGQCVVLWRAELGRVPIEAATCKGQDAHTCRPTPGLSCHEGDTRGAWPASSSLLAASRALACARLIISPCFQTLSVGRVAVTTPSPDPDL